jgi:hypothetical protein
MGIQGRALLTLAPRLAIVATTTAMALLWHAALELLTCVLWAQGWTFACLVTRNEPPPP